MSRPVIEPATDTEREQIRADIEEWAIIGQSQKSQQRVHIPGDDDITECASDGMRGNITERSRQNMVTKPTAVLPPGYHPICKYCVQAWRDNNGTE